jgi:hypothetical protein
MLLLDGLQSFCCRWTLIRALEVVNEQGTNLVPVLDSAFRQIDEQDLVALDNVIGRYLAFTRPSRPAASMTMS